MTMVLEARAKVNLSLHVTGRRGDGYHTLDTIMASVDLADTLWIGERARGITLSVEGGAPAGEENLAMRAARLLEPLCDGRGADILLIKRIPAQAGLGGGSADAAAALIGLNRLWDLNLPPCVLARYALRLGADVPFMLTGGLARCRGVGEDITPLPFAGKLPLLIIRGGEGLSTAAVYHAMDRMDAPCPEGSPDAAEDALRRSDRARLAAALGNDLEAPARALGLPVDEICADLIESGALAARMTGSGSAFFGLYESVDAATRAQVRLAARYPFCCVASTVAQGLAWTRE
ncbi:MAG: 4-(cytidine 5'-diphospho)-2-C-methyl-D-erythritol kinase [Clostridiales bacterium]|nr:4-(cytidine 5'-diphospho)-2-C-methyl-D-erythritol kinase [Clostridiales bacterium]